MIDKYFRFAPGDEVVAVRDHAKGYFKEGDEFTVISTERFCCHIEVDVGFKSNTPDVICSTCTKAFITNGPLFIEQSYFAPKLSNTQSDELIEEMTLQEA